MLYIFLSDKPAWHFINAHGFNLSIEYENFTTYVYIYIYITTKRSTSKKKQQKWKRREIQFC